jgi:hypothetical protein
MLIGPPPPADACFVESRKAVTLSANANLALVSGGD